MIQTELFGEFYSVCEGIDTLQCVKCKTEKPLYSFRERQRSESGETKRFLNCCKVCEKRISKVVSDIRKVAPPQSDRCDCCGEKKEKLFIDHCHETDKFRGWLCINCNVGISRLGDNIEGLKRAIEYISK